MGGCSPSRCGKPSPAGKTVSLQREQQALANRQHAIANSDSIRIMIRCISLGRMCSRRSIEVPELSNVLTLLEKAALQLGLDEEDAAFLQLEFCGVILDHQLELKASGLCDESQCSVLGVEVAKANKGERLGKSGALFTAAETGRVWDVRLVCEYAPESVNVAGRVMLPYMHCGGFDLLTWVCVGWGHPSAFRCHEQPARGGQATFESWSSNRLQGSEICPGYAKSANGDTNLPVRVILNSRLYGYPHICMYNAMVDKNKT